MLAFGDAAAAEVEGEDRDAGWEEEADGVDGVASAAAVAVEVDDAGRGVGAADLRLVKAAAEEMAERALQVDVHAAVRHAADAETRAGEALGRVVLRARGADHHVHELGPRRAHREGEGDGPRGAANTRRAK